MDLDAREIPSDYDLRHKEFRPHQLDTIRKLESKLDGSVTILQAVTGSGKSTLARAMGKDYTVTSLVKTKSLQNTVYRELDFDILFGRANYPCVHPDRITPEDTAADCMYELRMEQCEYADLCPYLEQKSIVQDSNVRSLNYAYFLTSQWPRKKPTKYGFYDECHILPDETLEFVGCTIRDGERMRWRLAEFPSCYDSTRESATKCMSWLEKAVGKISLEIAGMKTDDAMDKAKKSRGERLRSKLAQTYSAMQRNADDWYIRSGQRALDYMGNKTPGLQIKPLTARHHFPKLFLGVFPRTVLMSATVGNVSDLADELGIERYDFDHVPNQWPPESRPVHVLDVPSLGQSAKPEAFQIQAQKIAKVLNELPQDWSGIIHTTSWRATGELQSRLEFFGVETSRLFIPTRGRGTHHQMSEWNDAKLKKPGMIVITPSMNQGVDLLEERICIIAKTPWPFTAPGTFEDERRNYSNRFYRWQCASDLEQRAGRTRRGNIGDYDTDWQRNGFVCIADGSFKRMGLAKSCSSDFVESLKYE